MAYDIYSKAGTDEAISSALADSLPDLTGYVQNTDTRLGDARTPTAHAASHKTAGADALTAADIGAQPAGSYAAASHTQAASTISDSTAVGRSVLTAVDAAAARTAIGAQPAGSYAAASHTHAPADIGAATAAQGAKADATTVEQVTLNANLDYTLPTGTPAGVVHRVVFTQDGTGGHTVTYGGAPVTVALAAGAGTVVEFWPGGGVVYPGAAGGLEAADLSSVLGLQYMLRNPIESAPLTSESVVVIGAIDGVPYGRANSGGGGLYRSDDDGATWQLVNGALAYAIVSTHDGEVIINSGSLRKSSGWSTDPTTASFTTVLTTVAAGASIIQSNLDSYDNLVIAAEYGNADARYVYLSTDHGATFAPVCDLDALTGNPGLGHWHAVCIDQWHTGPNPRLWASHGDGPRGVYYSDDLGVSWTQYSNDWQPMPLIATPNGIVTGTDQNNPDGVWLIPRTLGPKKLLCRVSAPTWAGSLIGFGNNAARDPRDQSRVIIAMQGDQQAHFTYGNPARLFVSDGYAAAEVYQTLNTATVGVVGATQWVSPVAVTNTGKLLGTYVSTAGKWHVVGQLTLGAPTKQELDKGNVLTGTTSGRSNVAIGVGSKSVGVRSVVIGAEAGTTSQSTDEGATIVGDGALARHLATSVGHLASAGLQGTALGYGTDANYEAATAIGHDAKVTGINSVAVGKSSRAIAQGTAVGKESNASGGGIAIGSNTTASGFASIAIGGGGMKAAGSESIAIGTYETRASAASATAIGKNARAMNAFSVALGSNTTTNAEYQIALGPKHIELTEVAAAPGAPAVDQARLYIRDDGAGKTQLCIRFATGAVQVIATEP